MTEFAAASFIVPHHRSLHSAEEQFAEYVECRKTRDNLSRSFAQKKGTVGTAPLSDLGDACSVVSHPVTGQPVGAHEHRRGSVGSSVGRRGRQKLPPLDAYTGTVPKEDLFKFVQIRANEEQAVRFLPFALLFFIAFVLVVWGHENISQIFSVEQTIAGGVRESEFDEGKTLLNIHTEDEFWQWLRVGMINTLFRQTDAFGNELPQSQWGRYERYNQIVGGVNLILRRSKDNQCINPDLDEIFRCSNSKTCCHDPMTTSKAYYFDNSTAISFGPVGELGPFGVGEEGEGFKARTNGEYRFFMPTYMPVSLLRRRIDYLVQARWVDLSTKSVDVAVFMYNGELGLFAKLSVTFDFFRGGSVKPTLKLDTVQSDPYRGREWAYFLDALFAACFLFFAYSKGMELSSNMWSYGYWTGFKLYAGDFWNFLDWLVVGISAYAIYDWAVVVMIDHGAIKHLIDFTKLAESEPNSPKMYDKLEVSMDALEDLILHVTEHRTLVSVAAVLMGMRFFNAFRKQPMLSVVTRTLAASIRDAFHPAIVFFCIFFAFCFSGMVLFGYKISYFRDINASLSSCLLLVMGWFHWSWLGDEGTKTNTMIFMWLFGTLVALIMLNLLLAIVIEAYLRIRAGVANEDTVWMSGKRFIRNVWRHHLPHYRIEQMLFTHDDNLPDEVNFYHIAEKKGPEPLVSPHASSVSPGHSKHAKGTADRAKDYEAARRMSYWQQKNLMAGQQDQQPEGEKSELRLAVAVPAEQALEILDGCVKWTHHVDSQTTLTIAEALVMIGHNYQLVLSLQDSINALVRRLEALRGSLNLPIAPSSSTPPHSIQATLVPYHMITLPLPPPPTDASPSFMTIAEATDIVVTLIDTFPPETARQLRQMHDNGALDGLVRKLLPPTANRQPSYVQGALSVHVALYTSRYSPGRTALTGMLPVPSEWTQAENAAPPRLLLTGEIDEAENDEDMSPTAIRSLGELGGFKSVSRKR
ncbi:unnamed protein product [Vitrella brassicaformis CCMP3155]|uniref:Uncharacterized protein n=2 Tax=Vitrella brassicaformis TaxID=1169539 RepID=A0A0G4GQA9_VITBC|nr:unnamed protein product [Vitrella brassicaformis CCMP3155]|eukprot:CEM32637.1 unnamed protein product [Vitrella brassicaformis CCMP3155]